jgi:hypothetical protein
VKRSDKIQERLRRTALAEAWKAAADTLTDELEQEAREELARNGTRPSWSVQDIADVVLPLSKQAVVIDDIDALKKWTAAEHPEQIQTETTVRPAFQKYLLENARIVDGAPVLEDGTPIPGLKVRQGGIPGTLSFKPTTEVKALLANYAAQEVARALAAEYGEAVAE